MAVLNGTTMVYAYCRRLMVFSSIDFDTLTMLTLASYDRSASRMSMASTSELTFGVLT